MPGRVDPETRRATVTRLRQLRAAGDLTGEHVRLAASGLGCPSARCGGGSARTEAGSVLCDPIVTG